MTDLLPDSEGCIAAEPESVIIWEMTIQPSARLAGNLAILTPLPVENHQRGAVKAEY